MSSDHERRNREFWDADADDYQAVHGAELAAKPLAWGTWRIPEAEVGALGDVAGRDVLELGCGAAQCSIALAGLGARPIGLDQSVAQLRHARARMANADVSFPLVLASAQGVPLRDASFDIVFCDHGAMSFCDPQTTVPEVARLLRHHGLLAFCKATVLHHMAYDERRDRVGRRLCTPYFGVRVYDSGEGTVDFQIPYGDWIRLFRANGLQVEDLVELRPDARATTTYRDYVPLRWARRWPAEEIWRVRKL